MQRWNAEETNDEKHLLKIKIKSLTIFIIIVFLSNVDGLLAKTVQAQHAHSQDQLRTERMANYAKYIDQIKQLIPDGWNPGDLIEAKLKNQ